DRIETWLSGFGGLGICEILMRFPPSCSKAGRHRRSTATELLGLDPWGQWEVAGPNSSAVPRLRSEFNGLSWPAALSSAAREVETHAGMSPLTRIPRGPSSSDSALATMPSPERRPLDIAIPGRGARTDVESTNAMEASCSTALPTVRAIRIAPRKTASNELRHCRSSTSMMAPGGGPPTLISAPSRRPKFAVPSARPCPPSQDQSCRPLRRSRDQDRPSFRLLEPCQTGSARLLLHALPR